MCGVSLADTKSVRFDIVRVVRYIVNLRDGAYGQQTSSLLSFFAAVQLLYAFRPVGAMRVFRVSPSALGLSADWWYEVRSEESSVAGTEY